nr:hypothetical protein KPHV_30480 [Kitasatospora purpeofusca]
MSPDSAGLLPLTTRSRIVRNQRAAQSPRRGKPALDGLQALDAAAKKKQPDAHDAIQPNPAPRDPEAARAVFPPLETARGGARRGADGAARTARKSCPRR